MTANIANGLILILPVLSAKILLIRLGRGEKNPASFQARRDVVDHFQDRFSEFEYQYTKLS